ncbi:MAG: pentapeptide repeat-containing protein, partial [Candidatus Chromulinivorax sp.]
MNFFMKFMVVVIGMLTLEQLFGYVPVQVAALKKVVQAGDAVNCANCDLRGVQELAGLQLAGAFMPGITLQPCIANDQNKSLFMVCDPKKVANLTGINLQKANLMLSCLDYAIFDTANLAGANLSNTSIRYASLKDANIKDIILTGNESFCH